MIRIKDRKFVLETKDTTYAFEIRDTGHAEHLYYGKKIIFREDLAEFGVLRQKREFAPGNAISYDADHPALSMEDTCLEISGYGKGDLRSPMVDLVFADGSRTVDFIYESHRLRKGIKARRILPGSYDAFTFHHPKQVTTENTLPPELDPEELADVLTVSFVEKSYKVKLNITYTVFEKENVITRYVDLINESDGAVMINRLLSLQLDLSRPEYEGIFFDGAWAREMHSYHVPLEHGMHVSRSNTGTSSNRANPFFMISNPETNEDSGECYGFNLIYSGNHMEITDINAYGKLRILSGINDENFCFVLNPGEFFEAPEAVMTFSANGFNSLSHNMHDFIREHIIRGEWKDRERPVLLNSWEASYFKFDETKLLRLAKRAADVGIELFVMDDGWFGERDDDTKSLGDWEPNPKKLPGGLKGLCEKINRMGLSFGLWVEPEMVNVNSNLYREHPDWCLANPNRDHSEGRNQRILDLSRKDVREYIIETMSKVFSSANVEYVKWDMNRIISDIYSVGPEVTEDIRPENSKRRITETQANTNVCRSGELTHRYVLGLYEIMAELTKRFPHILFEGCASGGNRFDLGILCYFPQIWASDNTDPVCRAEIQQGYSYGYPIECMGAHVSASPNHQTLRRTPLKTRYAVAAFASLGYECNLNDFSKEQMDEVREEILIYKKYRRALHRGKFFRGGDGPLGDYFSGRDGYSVLYNPRGRENTVTWTLVSEYGHTAVGMMLNKLVLPNTQSMVYYPRGLEEDMVYSFSNYEPDYDIRNFGDLVNTVAPIHVKQDSLLMDILAKRIKLPSEKEEYVASGSLLMNAGVALKQNYSGTGYNENVRYMQDFAVKFYLMEAVEDTRGVKLENIRLEDIQTGEDSLKPAEKTADQEKEKPETGDGENT